jgi:hypothetical protein
MRLFLIFRKVLTIPEFVSRKLLILMRAMFNIMYIFSQNEEVEFQLRVKQ